MSDGIKIISAGSLEEAQEALLRLRTATPPTEYIEADNTKGTTDKRAVFCYVEDQGKPVGSVAIEPGVLPRGGLSHVNVGNKGWYVSAFQFHWEALIGGKWVPNSGKLYIAGAGKYFPVCGIKWVPATAMTAEEQPDMEFNGELSMPGR
ncbi:MAG: hypothetical protein ABI163_15505 [Thermoanaerobaculia bacterium]